MGALSKHERKDIKVNMFGNADPKYLSKLYQKIEHYDISDIVSINKPKQDNLYNNSDAIILPSYYEGFPNVLLEAMKFGKVILISKQAEQNNIIKDGDNGFTFDAYNILEMKKAILESRNLTQNNIEKMCLINNRLIKKKFSIDKIVKHWEKLYN